MSNHLWHRDVLFHSDVARDFLVLEEIVDTKSPTLIGPRSGGIPGVFHGPLWYYLNLIPFIVVSGSPVLMGWFWWLLSVLAVGVFLFQSYTFSKNITTSLLTSIVFALLVVPSAAGPLNTFFADLYSFLVFIVWLRWFKNPTHLASLVGWFSLGVLAQFQMAFAIPLILVWMPLYFWKVIKEKKYRQLSSFLILLIPFSSFLFFDLRHDWLQLKSVLNYISGPRGELHAFNFIFKRLNQFLFDGINVFKMYKFFNPIIIGVFLFFSRKIKDETIRSAIKIGIYLYASWWVITLVFSGEIWAYYYSQFFGMILFIMGLISSKSKPAKIFLAILTIFVIFNSRQVFIYTPERFNTSSWVLLQTITADALSVQNVGYFLYSQDQFAYPLKYSFSFYQKSHDIMTAKYFQKSERTVLVKAEDDPHNPYSTAEDWQLNKLKINQNPTETRDYPFGYKLEFYDLNQENLNSPVDPNLITNLHFR